MSIKINIDGKEITSEHGGLIIDIARKNGIEIPALCRADGLEPYAACGICVVEAEGMPRLIRACSTAASDGMVIHTRSEKVVRSRKAALELLLSDHTGDCRAPCSLACPGETDCQGYVGLIANGQHNEALQLIKEKLPLPASIGRVCPHPCEDACRRRLVESPVNILGLKRFAADLDLSDVPYIPERAPDTGFKAAIVGGGPAGLSCAYFLALAGHHADIFDAMPKMGGMLRYGIPQYRLPKDVLDREIAVIARMGVGMKNGVRVGTDITLAELRGQYDAVFVGVGAWKSVPLGCPGDALDGVLGGIDFLRGVACGSPPDIGRRVIIIGGGNTAMDACRTAVRLGAETVILAYRRTRDEMPADALEIEEAMEEGVKFKFLLAPIEITGQDGRAGAMLFQKMKLGEPDDRGRRAPVPVKGETELIEADTIIMAIGQSVDASGFEDLGLTKRGAIIADENTLATGLPAVFAGGDAVNSGPGIAIEAIGQARRAAGAISRYLGGSPVEAKPAYWVSREMTGGDFKDKPRLKRESVSVALPQLRRTNFEEVSDVYGETEAMREASRCLECGCHDLFECSLIKLANEYGVQNKYSGEVHRREYDDGNEYIIRNPDKCILCGLCVRVCEETVGACALGLADRGFDTLAGPAPGYALQDTDCVSCGTCVTLCPTGALGHRSRFRKQVPVREKTERSVCSMCGLGCVINVASNGGEVLRVLPEHSGGLLCASGSFGVVGEQYDDRLHVPMLIKNGIFELSDWKTAARYIVEQLGEIREIHGGDSVAVALSGKLSCEEIFAARKLAEILGISRICGLLPENGVERVLGRTYPNTFAELEATELVISFVPELTERFTPLSARLRRAVREGRTRVISACDPARTGLAADFTENIGANGGFAAEFLKALIAGGFAGVGKLDDFGGPPTGLDGVTPGPDALRLASEYASAKRAMLLMDSSTSTEDETVLAKAAAVTGHYGKPRNGIIRLLPDSNSRGLELMAGRGDLTGVVGLLAFGGCGALPDGIRFAVVSSARIEDMPGVSVMLPSPTVAERGGVFINSEGRLHAVGRSAGLHGHLTAPVALAKALGFDEYASKVRLRACMKREYPFLASAHGTVVDPRKIAVPDPQP